MRNNAILGIECLIPKMLLPKFGLAAMSALLILTSTAQAQFRLPSAAKQEAMVNGRSDGEKVIIDTDIGIDIDDACGAGCFQCIKQQICQKEWR